jgi:5-methylcytosine-specific restriction endonuclease McrA
MARAKKICGHAGCFALVPSGTPYCEDHAPAAWVSERGNRPNTYALRALHKQVIVEEPFCACGNPSTQAGHIVPRAYGGKDVRENLTGICHPCNKKQIAIDAQRYA